MTLKGIVWTFVIIALVGWHVHIHYVREAQKDLARLEGIKIGKRLMGAY